MIDRTLLFNRHYLTYLLAATVVDYFPGTQMLEGKADDGGFSYDFVFLPHITKNFSPHLLEQIEDAMRQKLSLGFSCKQIEMMRENAQQLFINKGQALKAECIEDFEYNIIPLIQSGNFFDVYIGEWGDDDSNKSFFKLLDYIIIDDVVRITGVSFFDKKNLKNYQKKYQHWKEHSAEILGPQLKLFIPYKENYLILPKGKILIDILTKKFEQAYQKQGYSFIISPLDDPFQSHQFLFEEQFAKKRKLKVAEFQYYKKDFTSIFCSPSYLEEELISSLQFMQKTIKIFGFEYRLEIVKGQKTFSEEQFTYFNELPQKVNYPKATYQFYLYDNLERSWKGPKIEVLSFPNYVHIKRSFFDSLEGFLALTIEKFSGELPFWLAPEQVRISPLAQSHEDFAKNLAMRLQAIGIRGNVDISREASLKEKVFEAQKEKVPYLVVIGDKEIKQSPSDQHKITVRSLNQKEQTVELEHWIEQLDLENKSLEF